MLSLYGATAIFLFAIPLALGLFYYLAPLQIGARGTALPRLGQLGMCLYVAGATVLYAGFLFTPSEAGVNPLAPLSELAFLSNNGVDAWATGDRAGDARLRPHRRSTWWRRCATCAPPGWPGGGCRSSPGRRRSAPG